MSDYNLTLGQLDAIRMHHAGWYDALRRGGVSATKVEEWLYEIDPTPNPAAPVVASDAPLLDEDAVVQKYAIDGITSADISAIRKHYPEWYRLLKYPVDEKQCKELRKKIHIWLDQIRLDNFDRCKESAEQKRQQEAAEATWAPLPTPMTRVSPFFPRNRNQLCDRKNYDNERITQNRWGYIEYTGPQLSVYDEDALLALLYSIDKQKEYRTITQCDGEDTYTYRGPVLPLLRAVGKTNSKANYIQLLKSLDRLSRAEVHLFYTNKNSKGDKYFKEYSISNILQYVDYDTNEKILTVTIHPYFYKTIWIYKHYTLINLKKRTKLNTIARALYRFFNSHHGYNHMVHIMTLSHIVNISLQLQSHPLKEKRRLIKEALEDLKNNNLVTDRSDVEKNMVYLFRTIDALPQKSEDSDDTD